MSRIVFDQITAIAPPDRKHTSNGWVSFNGSCCIHNGEKRPDTRKRAGLRMTEDGATVYHCFNCGFTTSWRPGQALTKKFKALCGWMGMSIEDVRRLNFKVWQLQSQAESQDPAKQERRWQIQFAERLLPSGARPFEDWLTEENPPAAFLRAAQYVSERGDDILTGYQYWWAPGRDMETRVILPFWWKDKCVGYTARSYTPTKHRYISDVQSHFLFNNRVMSLPDRRFIVVVEGPFDAIGIDGVATLGGTITPQQAEWLNNTGKQIVVVPDREHTGHGLADAGIEYGWSVSYPDWQTDIGDVADAVQRYGRLYTLMSIMEAKTTNRLQINILKKRYSK